MLQLATEKGASSWLTSLPLKEFGYVLNKQQFCDAIAIRYNLTLKDCPKVCACGQKYSVNHALICKLGGYTSMRHNWLRDTIGKIMKSVKCKDVQIEPWLLPVDGQHLPSGTELGDQARLDISARSVWNVLEQRSREFLQETGRQNCTEERHPIPTSGQLRQKKSAV